MADLTRKQCDHMAREYKEFRQTAVSLMSRILRDADTCGESADMCAHGFPLDIMTCPYATTRVWLAEMGYEL